MIDFKYLRDKQYYEDIYDRHTIEQCRSIVTRLKNVKFPKKLESQPEKEKAKAIGYLFHLPLFFIKGERYVKRAETIENWMSRDRQRDDFVETHPAPTAYCPKCNKKMDLMVNELDWHLDDDNLRMLHMYRCESCQEKKAFYSDGEQYVFEKDLCPKCQKEWVQKRIRSKNKITTKYNCLACGYQDEDVLNLNFKPKEETVDPNFEKERVEFCLSEKEGEEYRRWKAYDYPQMVELVNEFEEREKNKKFYDAVQNLKKLNISELSDLLAENLAESDFRSLTITNTEISRDLIITFTVQDTKKGRDEYHSKTELKKSISVLLDGTNWRLMSDGITYKLGLLTGRLRGMDDEKEMVSTIKSEN